MNSKHFIIGLGLLWMTTAATKAQIPLEVLAGPKRSSLDLMFFHFLGKDATRPGRFLYFNRNRVSQEYRIGDTLMLPLWGWTGAISYGRTAWKGFAPVLSYQVGSFENALKPGLQYAHQKHETTFFSWLVCDPFRRFPLELFALFRRTFPSDKKLKFYIQAESFHRLQAEAILVSFHTHRLRIGLHFKQSQYGLGFDYHHNWVGRNRTTVFHPGIFFRTVFS